MNSLERARALDRIDPLRSYRDRFHLPGSNGSEQRVYLNGNSLGLPPRQTGQYVQEELDVWARYGIEGYFRGDRPWIEYQELLSEPLAAVVGASPDEVVVMNTLTVNLHLMLVSFYRPTPARYKILMESDAFSSDRYAVRSQLELHSQVHGFPVADAVIEARPRPGERILRDEDIVASIADEGESIALVLLGHPNYLTGQAFDIPAIVRAAREKRCVVGLDLAHGAGNLALELHDWDVDFAVWCSYKYLNGGPGALAGCFIHERHFQEDRPRLAGWWGHNLSTRFQAGSDFDPTAGARGWQISNPPILPLAALRASLELFAAASMRALRDKSEKLSEYFYSLLDGFDGGAPIRIVTPSAPAARGCQLSLELENDAPGIVRELNEAGFVCDFREPDIIRIAPVPLYNSFEDLYRFTEALKGAVARRRI